MVSERYYLALAAHSDVSAQTVEKLVVQLGCLARGDGFVADLTVGQWTALRYCSRANRFSRIVSAFAEFHGTTRGTASQTIKSLVQNDYLTQKHSKTDGRSIDFTLTHKSRRKPKRSSPFLTPCRMSLRYSSVGKRRADQIGKKKFRSSKLGHSWP